MIISTKYQHRKQIPRWYFKFYLLFIQLFNAHFWRTNILRIIYSHLVYNFSYVKTGCSQ